MKGISTLAMTFCLAGAVVLRAQDNPFSADARQTYTLIKDIMLKAADRMPAEAYSFRTAPQVRSFAEMIAQVADAQLRMCGVVKGESPYCQCGFKKHERRTRDRIESVARLLRPGV